MVNTELNTFIKFFIAWVVLMTIFSFVLAKRKTDKPWRATIIGFFCAFIPPIVMFYLVLLGLREDVNNSDHQKNQKERIKSPHDI